MGLNIGDWPAILPPLPGAPPPMIRLRMVTLKLQDWTLTDDFAGLDIPGLGNDGRMCGQLTELKLQNFIP